MLIKDLLAPWFHYSGGETFNHLTLDSRAVKAGDIFVAVPGYALDGRLFIEKAFINGAIAALVNTDNPDEHGKVYFESGICIYFFQLNKQLSPLALQCYPLHEKHIKLIGVTGTNGKTSITQLIAQLLVLHHQRAAVMGTMGNGEWLSAKTDYSCGHKGLISSNNTTPDPISLINDIHLYENQGIDVCALEVSSHGLVQGRVSSVPFDLAVFTNLSRDHLDFHGNMEAYAAAKFKLFTFPTLKAKLLNIDDHIGYEWFSQLNADNCFGYSVKSNSLAAFRVLYTDYHGTGVTAQIYWPNGQGEIHSSLLGEFNLSNLLGALASLHLLGYNLDEFLPLVSQLQPIAGRMECFSAKNFPTLVVDYAHTPDGLEHALKALKQHCKGNIWCVFGCGGDRDKGKRPLMGKVAERYADKVMITSDNIRSEDPMQIIADIQQGLENPENAMVEVDRKCAIKKVIELASDQDIVLLAGKGHETYQEIAGIKYDYNERAIAAQLVGNLS